MVSSQISVGSGSCKERLSEVVAAESAFGLIGSESNSTEIPASKHRNIASKLYESW